MIDLYNGFQMKLIKKYVEKDNKKYLFNNGYGAIVTEENEKFNVTLIHFELDINNDNFTYSCNTNSIIPCITNGISYNELLDLLDDISVLKYRKYINN